MKRGKKYVEAAKNIDRQTLYEATEAVSLVKKSAVAKFDETIEAHIRTGCDGRHAEQQIRGAVVLPHGTGKTVKVLVFAKGAKAEEAEAAGADFVGGEELIPKIQNDNWFDFDVVALEQEGFKIINNITWQKTNPPPNLACRCFTHSTETILWAKKNDKKSRHFFDYQKMKEMNGGKQMKDVWTGALTKPSEKTETTGVEAVRFGRKFIGIDVSEEYLEISKRRLEKVANDK